MHNAALIVAAGRGTRFNPSSNDNIPKQYYKIDDSPILYLTMKKFLDNNNIDLVKLVIHPDDIDLYNKIAEEFKFSKKLLDPTYGATLRQNSVLLGLKSLESFNIDKILIHDGVRPFVCDKIINESLEKIKPRTATMVAKKIFNTQRRIIHNKSETIDRNNLYSVETPQGFIFKEILEAHEKYFDQNFTDDIALIEGMNMVEIIESDNKNDKITTTSDLPKNQKYRNSIGLGFDAHKFKISNKETFIKLGGIDIVFDKEILAHSDGDVILHSLVDAIFGAIGAGDIGMHFPPSDNKWKNADSCLFINYALNMLKEKNAVINNVDITFIAEKPKIGKYRTSMQQKIAEILEIDILQVNIKATTTEAMGFTGREEGIAAQAIISIELPSDLK